MNMVIEYLRRELLGREERHARLREERDKWQAMTPEEFDRYRDDLYAQNLHAPHSLESEREITSRALSSFEQWGEDVNMVLAVWEAGGGG